MPYYEDRILLRNTVNEWYLMQILEHIRIVIARCLLPKIIAHYESEKVYKESVGWKEKTENKLPTQSDKFFV